MSRFILVIGIWFSLPVLWAMDRLTIELSESRVFYVSDLSNAEYSALSIFLKNTRSEEIQLGLLESPLIEHIVLKEKWEDLEIQIFFHSPHTRWRYFIRSGDVSWRLLVDLWVAEDTPRTSRSSSLGWHFTSQKTVSSPIFRARLELLRHLLQKRPTLPLEWLPDDEKKKFNEYSMGILL